MSAFPTLFTALKDHISDFVFVFLLFRQQLVSINPHVALKLISGLNNTTTITELGHKCTVQCDVVKSSEGKNNTFKNGQKKYEVSIICS